MNFFEKQEKARQNTSLLIFFFFLAVTGIVLAMNLVAYFIGTLLYAQSGEMLNGIPGFFDESLWSTYGWTSFFTILFILIGAMSKWIRLGTSGPEVAEYLGGIPVPIGSKNPKERQLINIVEEMSIASGISVPSIYVLNNEHSINAFAAGMGPGDAAIAVTSGALDNLSREELQGVVAHEFSHIFNGDCRLNIRLIGYLAGIVTIGVVGQQMLRLLMNSSRGYRRRSEKSGGVEVGLLFCGLALTIIGYIGVFFGRLIRAAISRQREYLADATAIQYTRYPIGLAGALAKVKNNSSFIYNGHAEEASHMFFENPINPFVLFGGLLASHPPLEKRISAIDNRYLDEKFLETNLHYPKKPAQTKVDKKENNIPTIEILRNIGQPQEVNLSAAGLLLAGLHNQVKEHHGHPIKAQAMVLSILIVRDQDKDKGLSLVKNLVSGEVYSELEKMISIFQDVREDQYLPILELCIPTLKKLSPNETESFLKMTEYLSKVDGEIDFTEASFLAILQKHLTPGMVSGAETSLSHSWEHIKMVLASLAHEGQEDESSANQAYQSALEILHSRDFKIQSRSLLDGKSLIRSLHQISRLKPLDKKLFIEASLACIEHDGQVTVSEVHMFRAIGESLDCPVPLISSQ